MTEQAAVSHIIGKSMPGEGVQSQPLVTFALISYNNEKHITEAVRGALSQTYEPLEILISDDCSTDDTFKLIQEMVRGYSGTHRITTVRRSENLGLAYHLNKVFDEANGEYIVLAAGDDISHPTRTEKSIQELVNKSALLFHSNVDFIEGSANFSFEELLLARTSDINEAALSTRLYIGATGVVSRQLLEKYGPLPYSNLYEDQILGFRAKAEDRVCFSDRKLVKYRVGIGISSGKKDAPRGIKEYRVRRLSEIERRLSTLKTRLADIKASPLALTSNAASILEKEIKFINLEYSAATSPFQSIASGHIHAGIREVSKMLFTLLKAHARRYLPFR